MIGLAPVQTSVPRRGPDLASAGPWLRVSLISVLFVAAYWGPIRQLLLAKWLNDGNWSHGFLIPLFSVYFLYTKRDDLSRCSIRPSYLGALVLAFSLGTYFVSAWVYRMGYPQALSIVTSLFGVVLLLGGWGLLRVAWFPVLFLVLAIPLPDRQYVALTMPLRQWASSAAASLMPLFTPGLHTEAQAVVIDYVLPGHGAGTLNVEEACSGVRLMMAFVTLGVATAYIHDRPPWQRVVMVASCVPIAVLCNTIRVTTTGLLYIHGREEFAQGTAHQLLGIVMLLIALGLYALLGYVLSHIIVDEAEG